jgi:tRNA (guanine37-N1)-methyltransferase
VLTGGETAALVVVDAVARLVPGVLGNEQSAEHDSFSHGLLEAPHYTRPAEWRGLRVPDVLLSGHHGEVEKWRRREGMRRTMERRSDLFEGRALSVDEAKVFCELQAELTNLQSNLQSGREETPPQEEVE